MKRRKKSTVHIKLRKNNNLVEIIDMDGVDVIFNVCSIVVVVVVIFVFMLISCVLFSFVHSVHM